MEWLEASTENCPVGTALSVLGEKWTLLLVRDALNGVRRFDDFRRHIGLSEALLADRLRKLVEAGVLSTHAYQEEGRRERLEYRLTEKGRELLPVIVALKQWGEAHAPDRKGRVLEVRHRGCEGEVRAVLRCEHHPHTPLTARDTHALPGPAARRAHERRSAR
jgi:DNA-binding HxlR family transcriptional regulator